MKTKKSWPIFLTGVLACGLAGPLSAQPPGGTPGGGPPGGFQPPQPGTVLTGFLQDQLKLNAEQKKQLAAFQKEVDAQLTKILTPEQQKSLEDMRSGKGFGPFKGFGPPPGFGPPKGFGPPPGFGAGFGPANNDEVKKKIGATDEEWKVIGPNLQKVIVARRVLAADGATGGMTSTIVSQAQAELKSVLDDPKHGKADVTEKIAALRKARQKARTDLEETQRDLARLLTPAQEAIIMSLGYLE